MRKLIDKFILTIIMKQAYDKRYRYYLNICFIWVILIITSCKDTEKTAMNKSIVLIDNKSVKNYSQNIFGGFIEQFDDQVYGGIFDPGSPLSDESGFRKDVVAALKELLKFRT